MALQKLRQEAIAAAAPSKWLERWRDFSPPAQVAFGTHFAACIRTAAQAEMARQEEVVEASVFGYLFWLLIVLLIFALFSRYTIYQRPVPPPAASAFEHGNTPVAVGSEHSNSRQTRSLVKSNTVFREETEHGSTTL